MKIFKYTCLFFLATLLSCGSENGGSSKDYLNSKYSDIYEELSLSTDIDEKYTYKDFSSILLSIEILSEKFREKDSIEITSRLDTFVLEDHDTIVAFYDYIVIDNDVSHLLDNISLNRIYQSILSNAEYQKVFKLIDEHNSESSDNTIVGIPLKLRPNNSIDHWKGNTIKYSFKNEMFPDKYLNIIRDSIRYVFDEIEFYTKLKFKEVNYRNEGNEPIVLIKFSKSNNKSYVDCDNIGILAKATLGTNLKKEYKIVVFEQLLNDSKYSVQGILRHEIGHILGFLHTCVKYNNVIDCSDSHYNISNTIAIGIGGYDPASFMKSFEEACYFEDYELKFSKNDIAAIKALFNK